MAETPGTPFRIPAHLKNMAMAKAKAEGLTLTDVVISLLTQYVHDSVQSKSDSMAKFRKAG